MRVPPSHRRELAQGPFPPQGGGGTAVLGGGQVAPVVGAYSGIDSALKHLGHTMYAPARISAELGVQSGVTPGDAMSRAAFRDFVVNVQQLRVYLAMLGGQAHVTMIHTPGIYYSIAPSTSAYQGKVSAFIGDRKATREPTPICLPTTKSWEWHTGDAITNFAKLEEFYAREENKSTLWMPGAKDGAPAAVHVPNLLAIPNALVDLLQTQGAAITPYNVFKTVNDYLQSGSQPEELEWECIRKWCLVASQAGTNGKSRVFLDTSPVTIDNEEFDKWVTNCLDITFGPCPPGSNTSTGGAAGTQQAMDYLTLAKMLATTIGTNMM
jgi:hypothetical protein